MNSWKYHLLLLDHCPYVTWRMKKQLLALDPTLDSIYQFNVQEISHILKISLKKAEMIYNHIRTFDLTLLINIYLKQGIHIITIKDPDYPALLKEIYDPPFVLYAKGDWSLLNSRKLLSVVGTRYPTPYAKQVVQHLLSPLARNEWALVSGLAVGVDSLVHEECIKHNGKTIAVLGSGLFHIYPKQNKTLATLISEKHLLLSEYPPLTRPQKWHFPSRNRIISGMTLGTLVIEAKEKSGSLITAEQALEQGREVFAVPGPITQVTSVGTNKLIQLGAKLVTNYEDILEELNYE